MGCASVVSPAINQLTRPCHKWANSSVGMLAITLLSFTSEKDQGFSLYSNKLTNAKLKISNQTQFTKMNRSCDEGIQTQVSDLNTFIINSCYQSKGRLAQIEAEDQTFLLGSYIGKGTFNLDKLINYQASQQCKCELYQQEKVKGTLKMKITFLPQSYQILSFVFIDVFLLFGLPGDRQPRKTFIRVEIGEQILETEPRFQTKKSLPNWEDSMLSFRVPDIIRNGTITVYQIIKNKFIQVGKVQISLPDLLKEDGQRLLISDITPENRVEITASLKFTTIKGNNPKYQKQSNFHVRKEKKKNTFSREVGIVLTENDNKENANANLNEEKQSFEKKKLLSNENQNVHLLKTQP